MRSRLFLIATLFSAFSACARHEPPASLENARLAIKEASRYEANEYAATELAAAQQKLLQGEASQNSGSYEEARRLGEQATIDARYAQTRAQAERAQTAAIENRATATTLQRVR